MVIVVYVEVEVCTLNENYTDTLAICTVWWWSVVVVVVLCGSGGYIGI